MCENDNKKDNLSKLSKLKTKISNTFDENIPSGIEKLFTFAENSENVEFCLYYDRLSKISQFDWKSSAPRIYNKRVMKSLSALVCSNYKVKEMLPSYIHSLEDRKPVSVLLHGNPGCGKSTIAESIARSLGRPFVEISADDLNCDPEQECNPIIKEIIRHQNRHLVICISGIEYSHSDIIKRIAFNNEKIIDHYISDEVEFDLSSVQFVCCIDEKWTNQKSSLEIDSVEFIKDYANWGYVFEIFGYSEKEKIEIAKKSLIPSIKKEFGIPSKIAITDQAILKILRNYTIESGVNQLNSYLKIIARNINQLRDDKKQVKSKAVERILGAPHKIPFSANFGNTPIGSARFVYGSENGGGVDVVDAIVYETTGEEKLVVTGLIEDDTRQSIDLAISLFKKMIRELVGYAPKLNIHISFGSNELTGPSAGCSIVLAIISSYFDIPVNPSIISTGEVLLRGSVRAVGCIREKVLSAVKHQNEVFIMPKQSESDLAYVPKEYLRMIKVVTISDIYELVQAAFGISVNDLAHV